MFFLRSHQGSAVLIALIVLSLLTIVTTVFLEKIWGFSRSSNGIEASNRAYYYAVGIVEKQLIDTNVNKYRPWLISATGSAPTSFGTGVYMSVDTGGTTIPSVGKGNSPFDINFNILSLGEPIQLVIPNNISWSNVEFYFRVPTIGGVPGTVSPSSSGAILWTIGYTGASLFASGETNIFRLSDITGGNKYIHGFSGITNSGDLISFSSFYIDPLSQYLGSNGSRCANYNCTLKLSLIQQVPLTDGRVLPFIEYRVVLTGMNPPIPSQYMTIQSQGYAYGFLRSRTVHLPQITTNTALDFAVLQ